MLGKDLIMCTLLGGGSSGGEKTVVILPETTLMGNEAGMLLLNPLAGTPKVGGTYTVTYNGTDYKCQAMLYEADGTDSIMLGNSGAFGIPGGNTEAPFVILLLPEGAEMDEDGTIGYAAIVDLTGATSATLSIVEKVKVSGGGIPQADIDAAFAALAEKGVTIPEGATSADLDDLIESIVTGGGGGTGGITYHVEEITPASDASFQTQGGLLTGVIMDVENPPAVIVVHSNAEASQTVSNNGYLCYVAKYSGNSDDGKYAQYNALYWVYNTGSMKHYAPFVYGGSVANGKAIPYMLSQIAGKFVAGVTYEILMLWGVEW